MESDDNASDGTIVDATTEKAIDTEDRTDSDSGGMPIAAMIEGATPNDYAAFVLEEDGIVEQRVRGECTYGTWELSGQTGTSKTYDLDLEQEYSLTTFTDGSAELKVQGISGNFKGTWTEVFDKYKDGITITGDR